LPESDFDSPTPETLALIHDEVSTALKLQFERHDLLTSRAQQVVTFGGVILGIFLGLRPPGFQRSDAVIPLAIAVAAFIVLVLIGGAAWTMKGLRRDPAPAPLWNKYRFDDDHWLRQQLVLNLIASYEDNEVVLNDRARYLRWSLWVLGALVPYLGTVSVVYTYVR
jgi:hypothetical protein